jgi:membrane protease subunit (stomatin/prohibitin family)
MKTQGLGVADIAANLTNIEQVVLSRAADHFELYGVIIDKISGLYISLPEEVQKAVDTRASMTVVGANYMQYQTGQAMREAANNPSGGAAGVGVGVGAGVGMGYQMIDSMRQAGSTPGPGQQAAVAGAVILCPKCGSQNPAGVKFCGECGAKMVVSTVPCPQCGEKVAEGAKFCPNCGTAMNAPKKKCANCGAEVALNVKFCPECGKPT